MNDFSPISMNGEFSDLLMRFWRNGENIPLGIYFVLTNQKSKMWNIHLFSREWFFGVFYGFFGSQSMTSSVWLIKFDLGKVKFRPSCYQKIDRNFNIVTVSLSHKYAFLNGKFCCRTNKENKNEGKFGDLCDGSQIGIDSVCCFNDDFIKCSQHKCNKNEDSVKNESGSVFS